MNQNTTVFNLGNYSVVNISPSDSIMSRQTDTSFRELPNLIREETQVESESQTRLRNIVMKRQVRDRVIDSEGAAAIDGVLMRVGGCVFVCAAWMCKAQRISAH